MALTEAQWTSWLKYLVCFVLVLLIHLLTNSTSVLLVSCCFLSNHNIYSIVSCTSWWFIYFLHGLIFEVVINQLSWGRHICIKISQGLDELITWKSLFLAMGYVILDWSERKVIFIKVKLELTICLWVSIKLPSEVSQCANAVQVWVNMLSSLPRLLHYHGTNQLINSHSMCWSI